MRHNKQKGNATQSSIALADSEEDVTDVQRIHTAEGSRSEEYLLDALNRQGRHSTTFCSWLLERLSSSPRSLVLENSGSVARDHLASERTFLSYVRTSLVCVAAGIAFFQLVIITRDVPARLQLFCKCLGAMTELVGAGIMIIGVARYFTMQKALLDGRFPPARMTIWILVFSTATFVIIIFGFGIAIVLV